MGGLRRIGESVVRGEKSRHRWNRSTHGRAVNNGEGCINETHWLMVTKVITVNLPWTVLMCSMMSGFRVNSIQLLCRSMNSTVPTTLAPHSKEPGTNMAQCNISIRQLNKKEILIITAIDKYSFSSQDH
jgi:hypothetical protein